LRGDYIRKGRRQKVRKAPRQKVRKVKVRNLLVSPVPLPKKKGSRLDNDSPDHQGASTYLNIPLWG